VHSFVFSVSIFPFHYFTGQYAATVTSSLVSKLAQASDDFFLLYPELKKSTSQYSADFISDVYANTITPKLNDVLATLDTSPLATNTRSAIDRAPKTVETVLQFYNSKLAQLTEFKSKLSEISGPTGLSEFSTASKSVIGNKINENFDSVLNTYPQLKQSTSEFTVSALKNDVIPKLEETREFLSKSPLGISTKEFAARSTSDVVSSFSADVSTRFAPFTNVLADVSTRLITRATSPIADFFSGTYCILYSSHAFLLQK
jgi:hypothetical protein